MVIEGINNDEVGNTILILKAKDSYNDDFDTTQQLLEKLQEYDPNNPIIGDIVLSGPTEYSWDDLYTGVNERAQLKIENCRTTDQTPLTPNDQFKQAKEKEAGTGKTNEQSKDMPWWSFVIIGGALCLCCSTGKKQPKKETVMIKLPSIAQQSSMQPHHPQQTV